MSGCPKKRDGLISNREPQRRVICTGRFVVLALRRQAVAHVPPSGNVLWIGEHCAAITTERGAPLAATIEQHAPRHPCLGEHRIGSTRALVRLQRAVEISALFPVDTHLVMDTRVISDHTEHVVEHLRGIERASSKELNLRVGCRTGERISALQCRFNRLERRLHRSRVFGCDGGPQGFKSLAEVWTAHLDGAHGHPRWRACHRVVTPGRVIASALCFCAGSGTNAHRPLPVAACTMWDLVGETQTMRTAALCLILGTSIGYAGCTVDARDNMMAQTGSAGATQDSGMTASTTGDPTTDATTDVSDETSTGDGATTEDDTDPVGPILDVGPEETGGIELAEVFGHSGDTLYRLDPETLDVDEVGRFEGCNDGAVIDIALDTDSNMFGVSYDSLYEIDRVTAQCTLIASGSYPTSLSFVPEGTVTVTGEALVGFLGNRYVQIDTENGSVSDIAMLADGLQSSGDVVSVKDGGTYLTVFGPGCEDNDCIIQFNPSNGLVLQNYGTIPYDQVFGLAFWAGKAYGFARDGEVFEVDFMGDTVTTTPIPVPNAPAGLEFFGAGSTTSAPPIAG